MSVQLVVELPEGAVCIPFLKYQAYEKDAAPDGSIEKLMMEGFPPVLQKVSFPVAKVPGINVAAGFTVICRTPAAHSAFPQSGVPVGFT
jgi:hypothetical protein